MVNVPKKTLQEISDELRELKNWLTVMEEEYDMTPADGRQMKKSVNKIARLLKS